MTTNLDKIVKIGKIFNCSRGVFERFNADIIGINELEKELGEIIELIKKEVRGWE